MGVRAYEGRSDGLLGGVVFGDKCWILNRVGSLDWEQHYTAWGPNLVEKQAGSPRDDQTCTGGRNGLMLGIDEHCVAGGGFGRMQLRCRRRGLGGIDRALGGVLDGMPIGETSV